MPIYTGLIFVLFAFLAMGGCAATNTLALRENETECLAGWECRATGSLFIFRGAPASVAELKTATGCLALALRDDEYLRLKNSQGETFQVKGKAYEHDYAEGVTSYQLEDRWVATGKCPYGLILYVSEIIQTDPVKANAPD